MTAKIVRKRKTLSEDSVKNELWVLLEKEWVFITITILREKVVSQ